MAGFGKASLTPIDREVELEPLRQPVRLLEEPLLLPLL